MIFTVSIVCKKEMKYHKKEKKTNNYLISKKLKLNNINKIDIKDKMRKYIIKMNQKKKSLRCIYAEISKKSYHT